MKVQIIYSFDYLPQQFTTIEIPEVYIDSKKVFFHSVTNELDREEKVTLVKLSCCIFTDTTTKNLKEPDWYIECNGKFWDNEILEIMKEVYNIDCSFTPVN